MTISILIPAYNYVARPLAEELSRQAEALAEETGVPAVSFEIIVADDASTDHACRRANGAIGALPHCSFIGLTENIGRSRIRNLLAERAQGEWLLLLDCDGLPVDNLFLKRYAEAVQASPDAHILCGGIVHPPHLPSPDRSLRYTYEKMAEKHYTAEQRNKHPYNSFRTFNVMIQSRAFHQVRFDDSFNRYGYEDVLFGMKLQEQGFRIVHIDNPLENQDIEPNGLFLKKTEEAMLTLAEQSAKLGESVYLHKVYLRLKGLGLLPPTRLLFKMTHSFLRKNLTGASPSMSLFAFYKIGFYATLQKKFSSTGKKIIETQGEFPQKALPLPPT